MNAASSAEPDFTGRCSVAPPAAAAPPSLPKPPSSTLKNERFIARHMMYDRIAPDEPTSDPAMISIGLFSEKPMPAAAQPEYELSIDTTTGISAPPIGMMISTPSANAISVMMMNGSHDCVSMKMMPKPSIAMREQQVDHVLARIHDRRALEQAELVLARELAERDHRTGERDRADERADEQLDAIAVRNRIAGSGEAERRRFRHHRIRDTHRRKTDQRVHRGDEFRHLRHLDFRRDVRADRAADDQRREQQAKPSAEVRAEHKPPA